MKLYVYIDMHHIYEMCVYVYIYMICFHFSIHSVALELIQ